MVCLTNPPNFIELTKTYRLFSPQLPPRIKLHALLDAYFNNVHPIRVFAFEHKPSFIRMLDEGQLVDASDQALLHIMCALGARFYALDYSESFSPLTKDLIQSAGSQWAKSAEEMFFADYSTISITKLKSWSCFMTKKPVMATMRALSFLPALSYAWRMLCNSIMRYHQTSFVKN
jgi:hypothetical protein